MNQNVPGRCISEKRAVNAALDLTIDYSIRNNALRTELAGFSFVEVKHE